MSRAWLEQIHGGGLNSCWILDDGILSMEELEGLFAGCPGDDWYREVQVGPICGLQHGTNLFIGRVANGGQAWAKCRFVDYRHSSLAGECYDDFIRRILLDMKQIEWAENSLFTADSAGSLIET